MLFKELLIYLEGDLRKKLLPLFHYSLNPEGILVLGSAETVGSADELFAPLSGKTRVFRRKEVASGAALIEFPVAFAGLLERTRRRPRHPPLEAVRLVPNLQALTDQLLLQRHSPAAVLTTANGDSVYFSGKTMEATLHEERERKT